MGHYKLFYYAGTFTLIFRQVIFFHVKHGVTPLDIGVPRGWQSFQMLRLCGHSCPWPCYYHPLAQKTEINLVLNQFIRSKVAPLSPSGRSSATPQNFSRNVPERSTFHAGTTNRSTRPRQGLYGIPNASQDTSSLNPGVRPSNFFSKISSKFSKRYFRSAFLSA